MVRIAMLAYICPNPIDPSNLRQPFSFVCHNHILCHYTHGSHHILWHCTHVYELSRLIYVLCSCLRPLMLYMPLVWPSLSHHYHSWVMLLSSPLKCIWSYFQSVWRRHHGCLSKIMIFLRRNKKKFQKIKILFWNPISRPPLLRKNTSNLKSYT